MFELFDLYGAVVAVAVLVGIVSLAVAAAAAVVNSTEIVVVGGPENVVSIALITQSWSGTHRRPITSSSRLVIPNKAISFDFRANYLRSLLHGSAQRSQ